MKLQALQKHKTKPKKWLGRKIMDVIKRSKKLPNLVYKFKNGKCYVFSDAPFKSLYVINNVVHAIDEYKDSREDSRYAVDGLVFAAPDGNTEYTIVGDILNISQSAVCVKPYKLQIMSDGVWKIHIDLGNSVYDAYGKVTRIDRDTIVFRFTEKLEFSIQISN